jgi:hypothetical protein
MLSRAPDVVNNSKWNTYFDARVIFQMKRLRYETIHVDFFY